VQDFQVPCHLIDVRSVYGQLTVKIWRRFGQGVPELWGRGKAVGVRFPQFSNSRVPCHLIDVRSVYGQLTVKIWRRFGQGVPELWEEG